MRTALLKSILISVTVGSSPLVCKDRVRTRERERENG